MKMKYNAKGNLETTFVCLIPYLLNISKSVISNHRTDGRDGIVYGIHITPFFGISIHWARSK